jgi:hypothetical protein
MTLVSTTLTIADVERVAALAHLELTAEEKQLFTRQLADILAYAEQVQAVGHDRCAGDRPCERTQRGARRCGETVACQWTMWSRTRLIRRPTPASFACPE